MSQRVPQVIVSLAPSGALKVELPGPFATRRSIELAPGKEGETLSRILTAQMQEQVEIGLDGAPTAAQLQHWERHDLFPRDSCRFCISEGRIKLQSKRARRETIAKHPTGVEIKRLHEGLKAAKRAGATAKTAEELDL